MTAPPLPEIIPPRASTVPVLRTRTFQRPLDPTYRPTLDDFSLIPTILRERNQWILWKYKTTEKGKRTKEPYQARNSHNYAKVNDPTTWDSFDRAFEAMNNGSGADGLGFVFTKESNLVVIDLDHVIIDGTLPIWIKRLLEQIRSYAEASPSGTGLHVIGSGTLPGPGSKRGDRLEMYSNLRYLTFTGSRLLSQPQTVEPVNVDQLHRLMIARAFDFTKNPKLEKLLNGNFSDYPSQSEADMAFCSQLAGLGLGAEDIDHMVRLSGLHRSKWDELHGSRTYGQMTIQAVLASPPSIITVGSDGAWSDALLRNDNGAPKALLANILMVLANDSKYQDLVAYDEFSGDIILQRPAAWLPNIAVGSPWNDTCDSLLTAELQKDYGFALQTRIAAEGLSAIAHQRSFHPVRDYLRSCVGDDKPRLNSWLPIYLGCEASPYTAAVGRCWLISGVARIMRPGVKADSVLGLIGPQGILKSTALEVLASEPWFTDHISPLGEKDSRLDLLGTWIVELAELDRVRGADLARVKNFLSTKVDKYRVPYGHRKQPFPRSCIFASTSNIGDMLCDETGNRRWWPVEVGVLAPIDIEALRRDKDLLWAEALRCYEAGEHWWLDSAELIKAATEQTEKHYESGTWDEQILNWCAQPKARFKRLEDHCIAEDLPMDSSYGRVTLADVLIHAVGKTLAQITPGDRMQARKCLVHAGWRHSGKPERVGRDQHLVRFYYRPTPGGSQ